MSKIGMAPVKIPEGVETKIEGQKITIKGPKGSLERVLNDEIKIENEDGKLKLSVAKKSDDTAALWGLNRALVANLVEGVTKGFEKKLQVLGVGYKVQVQGKKLALSLGFSHPVEHELPEGIEASMDKDILTISGIDKQLVGHVAAQIRKYREPEPYKGKGIRYVDEHVRRKVGKTAAGAAE